MTVISLSEVEVYWMLDGCGFKNAHNSLDLSCGPIKHAHRSLCNVVQQSKVIEAVD